MSAQPSGRRRSLCGMPVAASTTAHSSARSRSGVTRTAAPWRSSISSHHRLPTGTAGGLSKAGFEPVTESDILGLSEAFRWCSITTMRVLLISDSGRPFLEHTRPHIADFLGGAVKRLAFVTAASLGDEIAYYQRAQAALGPLPPDGVGVQVLHLRWNAEPLATLERADAVFVGGGNTYALLKRLREAKLLEPIRARGQARMPYIGTSAGPNAQAH